MPFRSSINKLRIADNISSTIMSEDIEYNPHIKVVEIIKDAININTYNDQVTEFNKDVQQWENRFLSIAVVYRRDLPESEKIILLSPLPILTLDHLEEPSSYNNGQVYLSDVRTGNEHIFTDEGIMRYLKDN